MDKAKYFVFFLLVTAAAYALSTFFLSYLDRDLSKDLSLHSPGAPLVQKKITPPLLLLKRRISWRKGPLPWSEKRTLKETPALRKSRV